VAEQGDSKKKRTAADPTHVLRAGVRRLSRAGGGVRDHLFLSTCPIGRDRSRRRRRVAVLRDGSKMVDIAPAAPVEVSYDQIRTCQARGFAARPTSRRTPLRVKSIVRAMWIQLSGGTAALRITQQYVNRHRDDAPIWAQVAELVSASR